MVTISEVTDDNPHSQWTLENRVDTGDAGQCLHAIVNTSGEALHQSDERSIKPMPDESNEPSPQWKVIPKQNLDGTFYITNAQSGHCLKDAECGTETATISADATSDGLPEHDSALLWKFVPIMAAKAKQKPKGRGKVPAGEEEKQNLTAVGDLRIKGAEEAMEFLIGQWKDNKLGHETSSGRTMLTLKQSDIAKPDAQRFKKLIKYAENLLRRGCRIDRQGYFERDGKNFANMQGQIVDEIETRKSKSVFQVNIEVDVVFGSGAIRKEMLRSMREVEEIWMKQKG